MLFIFDMGGVVTRDTNFDKRLTGLLGMTAEEFYAICEGGCSDGVCRTDIMRRLSDGEISSRQFWKEVERRSGKAVLPSPSTGINADPWNLVFNPVRDKGVVSIIERLREKYRVVCGTNTIEPHYMEHIERGDYALFDKVYASNRIGVSKPDTAFWQTILLAEGVPPEDAFFTDDREDNCEAAAALGLAVHRFTSADDLEKALGKWITSSDN